MFRISLLSLLIPLLLLFTTPLWASMQVEAEFLERMSQHHQEAIVISQIALKKSQDNEVKKLAGKIIKDQVKEQNEMKEVKEKKYSHIPLPPISVQTVDPSALEKLEGKQFDKSYLEMMTKHHKSGIEMMSKMLPTIHKRNIHRMAIKMVKLQGREIAKMEKMQTTR